MAIGDDPPVGLYFSVSIDAVDLGEFITCDGLGIDVETEDRIEGGNNSMVWKLPVRLKYSNVKFTRPVGSDSAKVAEWIATMCSPITRSTAQIVALTPDGQPVVTWSLSGVIPVKWTGPSFSAESGKVDTETLELAHHGFTFVAA